MTPNVDITTVTIQTAELLENFVQFFSYKADKIFSIINLPNTN